MSKNLDQIKTVLNQVADDVESGKIIPGRFVLFETSVDGNTEGPCCILGHCFDRLGVNANRDREYLSYFYEKAGSYFVEEPVEEELNRCIDEIYDLNDAEKFVHSAQKLREFADKFVDAIKKEDANV
jgi:hypothetical protein